MNFSAKYLLRRRLSTIVAIMSLVSFSSGLWTAKAADFIGADGVISLVKKATGSSEEQTADPAKEEAKRLMRDLESFKGARAKLPVGEAVEQWMKLYDRFRMLPPDVLKSQRINPYAPPADELSIRALISAIPPAATACDRART